MHLHIVSKMRLQYSWIVTSSFTISVWGGTEARLRRPDPDDAVGRILDALGRYLDLEPDHFESASRRAKVNLPHPFRLCIRKLISHGRQASSLQIALQGREVRLPRSSLPQTGPANSDCLDL